MKKLLTLQLILIIAIWTFVLGPVCVLNTIPNHDSPIVTNVYPTQSQVADDLQYLRLPMRQSPMGGDFGDIYDEGHFDCSEMSSYLWYYFTYKCHYKTYLVIGDNGAVKDACWILIQSKSSTILVESTILQIVKTNRNEYNEYIKFSGIRFLIAINRGQFDWWNSPYSDTLNQLLSTDQESYQ